jgi:hypothetical protein
VERVVGLEELDAFSFGKKGHFYNPQERGGQQLS